VGQGTPFIKSGRGARSKIDPKIRRTLPSHGFCVTSNLQNTTHKHKERADHPRKRAETTTNGKHKRAATTSRRNRRKTILKVKGYLQGLKGYNEKKSKNISKDPQRILFVPKLNKPNKSSSCQVGNSTRCSVAPTA